MSRSVSESEIIGALTSRGVPTAAAEHKAPLFARCIEALRQSDGAGEIDLLFVPGRIEVLGKHTDYAGGDSLLCAVSHGFCFAIRGNRRDAGKTPVLTVVNVEARDRVVLPVETEDVSRIGHWSNYPNTVWRRLQSNLSYALDGATIAFASDLPSAAGISSSSALVVGTFLALDAVNKILLRDDFSRLVPTIESLGDYLGCVENGRDYPGLLGTTGVGTTGGSQDQTAILCARENELQHFSFSPTTFRQSVSVPDGHVFVIASSGVEASKTGNALELYNRVGRRASEIVRIWNAQTGDSSQTLGDIVRRDSFNYDEVQNCILASDGSYSAESLLGRFDQFYAESFQIIPKAVAALEAGSTQGFSDAVSRSQDLAERHLENQVPETIALVTLANEEGAVAASAFGAGFGGSVWALVHEDHAAEFSSRWAARYRQVFPARASRSRFFMERPGPGAFKLVFDD